MCGHPRRRYLRFCVKRTSALAPNGHKAYTLSDVLCSTSLVL